MLSLLQLLDSNFIDQYALFPSNQRFSVNLAKYAKQSYYFPNSPLMVFLLFIRMKSVFKLDKEVVFHSHGPAAGLLGRCLDYFSPVSIYILHMVFNSQIMAF